MTGSALTVSRVRWLSGWYLIDSRSQWCRTAEVEITYRGKRVGGGNHFVEGPFVGLHQAGVGGEGGLWWASCSCGWTSDPHSSRELAEAARSQHCLT